MFYKNLIILSLCCLLSACGQTGALYLPKQKNPTINHQNNQSHHGSLSHTQ